MRKVSIDVTTHSDFTIGVIGSRRRDSLAAHRKVVKAFEAMMLRFGSRVGYVVSGGCEQGADRLAPLLAKKYGLTLVVHYPNYKKHGRIATFVRNSQVAMDAGYLIAAVHRSRTGGTEDTIKKFLKRRPERCLILV